MPDTKRTITLSFAFPPRELSPNVARRLHWAVKGKAAHTYREDCGWIAKTQVQPNQDIHTVPPLTSPVLATVSFHVTDRRRRDIDNLMASIKPLWDGIVDAGVLEDDSAKHLRHAESKVVVGKEKRVEVTLEEVDDGA